MQLRASLHKKVLIDDILKQRLGKTELRIEPRARFLVDDLGIEQKIELAAHLCRVTRDCAQERGIEARADYGGLLGKRSRLAR